eukprot:scaffold301617_cov15-Prasinocladus_malaysianus.AAC.1
MQICRQCNTLSMLMLKKKNGAMLTRTRVRNDNSDEYDWTVALFHVFSGPMKQNPRQALPQDI